MEEITKHINDTNASYRHVGAGDAKNTDLFLDNEHYELFRDSGEQITVRFDKTNLTQAILFIASVLPRKFDQSAIHEVINYSDGFVLDQLAILDAVFKVDGVAVTKITQTWNARKDVPKKNGEIDTRFYFNGLLKDVQYVDHNGHSQKTRFTIRNYFAGGFSNLTIKKATDGIFDIYIDNVTEPYNDGKEDEYEEVGTASLCNSDLSLQQIYYGAPGTGKSHIIKEITKGEKVIRTTFHPDSDYSTFVGAYKPTTKEITMRDLSGKPVLERNENGEFVEVKEEKIVYEFVQQAFLQAYTNAWKLYAEAGQGETAKAQYLVIEEINRGNCAQIFGDLFQLLDRNDDGFSDYPIKADNDMKKQLAKAFAGLEIPQRETINALYDEEDIVSQVLNGEVLLLPNNLYIWATMNTSDQSLFPIDSAFKRRWDWKYMPIHNACKNWRIAVNDSEYDWWSFLEKVNEYIGSTTNSEDKKLGYFFCKPKDKVVSAETFVGKVIFYLWNDVFKDYGFEGTLFECEDGTLTFDKFYGADAKTIKEDNVERFLKNLGLEPIEEDETLELSEEDKGEAVDANGEQKSKLVIRFEDGHVSKGRYYFDSYLDALQHIGIAKVETIASDMKYKRRGCPLISKTQMDGVLNDPTYSYLQDGEYYIVKGINNRTKEAFIRYVAKQLGIKLTYSYEK